MLVDSCEKKMDIRREIGGRKCRFVSFIDEQAIRFEARLQEILGTEGTRRIDVAGIAEEGSEAKVRTLDWFGVPLWQSCQYLELLSNGFFLFQMEGIDGEPSIQLAVELLPCRIPYFATGLVRQFGHLGCLGDEAELRLGFSALGALCREHTRIYELRFQPYVPGSNNLDILGRAAQAAGFNPVENIWMKRTRFLGIAGTEGEVLASFSQKTRAKIRMKKGKDCEIREIRDPKVIPSLERALQASFSRTLGSGVAKSFFDFSQTFELMRRKPEQVQVLGVYLPGVSEEPMAYAVAFLHGPLVEYSSAGSVNSPELRALPFNFFLVWQLILWGKRRGGEVFDFGGVSEGGEGDPLAGITRFKRSFTGFEADVGREMLLVLKPWHRAGYRLLKTLLATLKR